MCSDMTLVSVMGLAAYSSFTFKVVKVVSSEIRNLNPIPSGNRKKEKKPTPPNLKKHALVAV